MVDKSESAKLIFLTNDQCVDNVPAATAAKARSSNLATDFAIQAT